MGTPKRCRAAATRSLNAPFLCRRSKWRWFASVVKLRKRPQFRNRLLDVAGTPLQLSLIIPLRGTVPLSPNAAPEWAFRCDDVLNVLPEMLPVCLSRKDKLLCFHCCLRADALMVAQHVEPLNREAQNPVPHGSVVRRLMKTGQRKRR